jgi:hypothetical protein
MGNGVEIWYRGEGVGVPRTTPGSTDPHDIGDGYYLTDNFESAKAYANLRAFDSADQRLFSVKINRSSLRILDLTNNRAWQEFVKPIEPLLRGGAPKNYGQILANFINANKIYLNQYDAVIGLDYLRGGKQMSILLKGGKPSPLEVSIRGRIQPLTSATFQDRMPMPPIELDDIPVRVGSPRTGFVEEGACRSGDHAGHYACPGGARNLDDQTDGEREDPGRPEGPRAQDC